MLNHHRNEHSSPATPPPHIPNLASAPQGSAQPPPSFARVGALSALRAAVTVTILVVARTLWNLDLSATFGSVAAGAVIVTVLTVLPSVASLRFGLRYSWRVAICRAALLSLVAAIESPLLALPVLVLGLGALGALQQTAIRPNA